MILLTKYPPEQIEGVPVLSRFYGIVIRMVFIQRFAAHPPVKIPATARAEETA